MVSLVTLWCRDGGGVGRGVLSYKLSLSELPISCDQVRLRGGRIDCGFPGGYF
jgi:hypothetical protein